MSTVQQAATAASPISLTPDDMRVLANIHITNTLPETPSGINSVQKLQQLGWLKITPRNNCPARLTEVGAKAIEDYIHHKTKEAN